MNRREYVISINRPAKALSPNARGHWTKAHGAKKRARRDAAILANEAWGPTAPLWKHARVTIEWVMPTKAYHPDPDNAMASLKAQRDGFADWGIVENDKHLVPVWGGLRVEKTAEWPRGRVILTFREITAGMQEVPA